MKIHIISASMRSNSQSLKVSTWLKNHATKAYNTTEWTVLDLHELNLPVYDASEIDDQNAIKLKASLEEADGFIFVSPEWNGMMSHGLMNMMHYVGNELAHKPVMLAGVSAGRGGSYPLIQMRMIGYKNNHFIVSPENLLVQDVKNVLNDHNMSEEAADSTVKQRAAYALGVLHVYAQALQTVRTSEHIDMKRFPNGV